MNIEQIKQEILNSNLPGTSKLDALVLLDTATQGIQIKDNIEVITVLESLYDKVTQEKYRDVLRGVIKDYKRRIHTLSLGFPQDEMTIRDFLSSIGIDVSGIPQEKLNLKLTVGVDDGMGYTAGGFQDVIDSYPDIEEGVVRIWV